MRKFVAVLFLLLCITSLICGQKTRYGQSPPKAKPGVDYPIKVHISGMHIRQYCKPYWGEKYISSCDDVVYADAIMNGMRIELMGYSETGSIKFLESLPGEYHARLMKDNINAGLLSIGQKYELVFPDRTTWQSTVTGISE
jgi:hypothetical protein